MKRFIATSLLSAGLFIVGLGQAHAFDNGYADRKVFAGSSCVKYSGPTPTYYASSIGNPSTSTLMKVDCPVTRDGQRILSGTVQVYDNSPVDTVRCQMLNLYRRTNGSFTGRSTAWVHSSNSWPSTQSGVSVSHRGKSTLEFPGLPAVTSRYQSDHSEMSHYYFSCTVPRSYGGSRSYIDSFKVDEAQ